MCMMNAGQPLVEELRQELQLLRFQIKDTESNLKRLYEQAEYIQNFVDGVTRVS